MRCPCCGASGATPLTLLEGLQSQLWKVVSLIACVTAAIAGQSHLFGEPWEHVVTVAGTIAGALVAWKIKPNPVIDRTP